MDSAAQLALMSKAKKVFAKDKKDIFLSFPVSPLPKTKRQLDFFSNKDGPDAQESKENLQDFSNLVNFIPSDEAWLPTETRFLWEAYEEMLRANYAESRRTPEEEAAYQQARAYLGRDSEAGWVDSPAVVAYKQYRDAHVMALEAYAAAKGTGECAKDLAEQQQWRDVDEPKHRKKIDTLLTEWAVAGHKNEVEAAQGKVANLGARSPHQTWDDWKSRFNKDIGNESGASDQAGFYPSFFQPYNAVEDGAWQPFTLSEEEVTTLLNEAPAELRARFGGGQQAIKGEVIELRIQLCGYLAQLV